MPTLLARLALPAVLTITACASAGENRNRSGVHADEPLEYGEHCAEARRIANDSITPAGYRPPHPVSIPLPPTPPPTAIRGRTAVFTIRVDSAGRQVPSTFTLTGVPEHEWTNRLRSNLRAVEFHPASIGKCAVAGTAEIKFEL